VSKFKAVSIDAAFGLMERLVGGTTEVMANPIGTTHAVVIAREGGKSSTPRRLDSITSVTEYWIARVRGRR
jgi:hypothetical protein